MRATPCPSYATQHVKLTIATADTGRLIRPALWGLRRIYRPGFQYKKTGILFLDLAPAAAMQGSLFLQPDTPERVRLMALVDELNPATGATGYGLPVAGWTGGGSSRRSPCPSTTRRDGASC